MTDIKTAVCQAYYSGHTHAQIMTFVEQLFNDLDAANITGRFVLDEGDCWLDIEGTISAIDSAVHDLGQDSFFDSFSETTSVSRDRRFDYLYAYFEDEDPLTTM